MSRNDQKFILASTRVRSKLMTSAHLSTAIVYTAAISANDTSQRVGHTAVSTGKSLWVYGGHSGDQMKSTLECFDLVSKRWSIIKAPAPLPRRAHHSAVYYNERMYVFGGLDTEALPSNKTFTLDQEGSCAFLEATGHIPKPLQGHSAVVCHKKMYVFGGISEGHCQNALHEFDFKTNHWTKIVQKGTPPSARAFHSLCVLKGEIYCYGGVDDKKESLNDFYVFNPSFNSWLQIPVKGECVPSGKHGHTICSFRGDGSSILLFGGDETATAFEIYQYSVQEGGWSLVNYDGDSGTPRKYHTATPTETCIYIFGGIGAKSSSMDTIESRLQALEGRDQSQSGTGASSLALEANYRSDWEAMAMRSLPSVLELREKFREVLGGPSYSVVSPVGRTEVPSVVAQVLPLVAEFLREAGFKKTLSTLYEVKGMRDVHRENSLQALLEFAIRLTEDNNIFAPELKRSKFPWEVGNDVEVVANDRNANRYLKGDNIWKDEGLLQRRNGKIIEGTINSLVCYLVQRSGKDFKKTFLWCHRNFTTSDILLQKLIECFNTPQEMSPNNTTRIQKSVINTLKFWLQECPNDFLQETLSLSTKTFIEYDLSKETQHSNYSRELKLSLKKCEKLLSKQEDLLFLYQKSAPPPEPQVPRNIFSPDFKFESVPEVEIARQLTLHAHHLICLIGMSELSSVAWEQSSGEAEEKCPNIVILENWLQRITMWVKEEIKVATERKMRTKRLASFALLCEVLFELNNYHSLAGVLQGILMEAKASGSKELPSVFDKEWAKAPQGEEQLKFLNETAIPTVFGQRPKYHVKPCVPYLTDFLGTVSKVIKSEPHWIMEGSKMVNFNKALKLSLFLKQFREFQTHLYSLLPVHQVQEYFETFPKTKK